MKRQVALDTETTGKSDDGTPGEHRIIEVGCVEIIDRKLTGRTLQLYVNPERPVDEEAFNVHGISNEFLADKPKFAQMRNRTYKDIPQCSKCMFRGMCCSCCYSAYGKFGSIYREDPHCADRKQIYLYLMQYWLKNHVLDK